MTVQTGHALRLTRRIGADPQAVWDAWTQPEHVRKWSCPVPGGVRAFDCDLRVGGAFRLRMQIEGKHHTAVGEYRELDPPRRIAYTWDWAPDDGGMQSVGDTLVTVEFRPVEGGTEVVLTHEGLPTAEARKGHEEGWGGCLANFEALFT